MPSLQGHFAGVPSKKADVEVTNARIEDLLDLVTDHGKKLN
ncbi:MAG: hypothetical protein WBO23_16415 [Burkholderiales bacterium]